MKIRSTQMERKIIPVLGVVVDSTTPGRVLSQVQDFLTKKVSKKSLATNERTGPNKYFIVTPNPEIVTYASCDLELTHIINSAQLSLPDGIGVVAAQRYLSMQVSVFLPLRFIQSLVQGVYVGALLVLDKKSLYQNGSTVPGRLVFEELIRRSAEQGFKVYLIGAKDGIAQKAASALRVKYPLLKVEYSAGPWLDMDGKPKNEKESQIERISVSKINMYRPDILFVAFGHPKQEKWLSRNMPKLNIKIGMVVGGTLDYTAGRFSVPPKFVQEAGFEWLWRLVTQPRRVRRIYTAVFVFPWKVFVEKMSGGRRAR